MNLEAGLDRTVIPRTELGELTILGNPKGSVHFAHNVNIIDVMRMLRLPVWEENRRTVDMFGDWQP